jgi:hypothetical protein
LATRKIKTDHLGHYGSKQAAGSHTIGQCINGGLGWLREVECNRCKTRASLPLDAIRRPRDTPLWKPEASLKCRSCRHGFFSVSMGPPQEVSSAGAVQGASALAGTGISGGAGRRSDTEAGRSGRSGGGGQVAGSCSCLKMVSTRMAAG